MPHTLAIDFGSQYIGLALVKHGTEVPNRILYAATINVAAKPLAQLVTPRAQVRRIRRTRKTHQRRLRQLQAAIAGTLGAEQLVRFCGRRGYSYAVDPEGEPAPGFHVPRAQFFSALRQEVERVIPAADRPRVMLACTKHLNEACDRDAELRPARFENRGPSKCQWLGCHHNVPRADNDYLGRMQQAIYVWLKPVFDVSTDPARLRRSVDHWTAELDQLAHAYSHTEKLTGDARKAERKKLTARRTRIGKNLLARVRREASGEVAEAFATNWSEHYSRNLTDIVSGKQGGRVRYCRQHSRQFVDEFLAGRVIPHRMDVTPADLVSRRQQILFDRLWRLVEARLLPLAGGRIDRVVVERVAFDVLAGSFENRQKLSEAKADGMYSQGPMFGFASRRDMLSAEFAGKCAYCFEESATDQVEHLLPRSQFPLDSYFNVVPACAPCNARKGARSPVAAGMSISDGAYEAYCDYVSSLAVPHIFHTMKKGMLNLLRRSGNVDAERMLGMLANNLVTITNTQRGPRPLARYLATRLVQVTGHRPETAFRAGRHTALYRMALLPDYDKQAEKQAGDLRNHAVDAIMLGCNLPSVTALENPRWTIGTRDLSQWIERVRAAGPALSDGLPLVEGPAALPHFEHGLGEGYISIELSAFNWNQSRKATHGLDPFALTPQREPLKRIPAQDVLQGLLSDTQRTIQIRAIAKPGLRLLLERDPTKAALRFVEWLQRTTRSGLLQGTMSRHPADVSRRQLLEDFARTPAAIIVAGEHSIPWTIGIRCLIAGSRGKVDATRCNGNGEIIHRYQSQPTIREVYVGYAQNKGAIDRSVPIFLFVNQALAVFCGTMANRHPVDVPAGSPLLGRPHGSRQPYKEFQIAWQAALDELCARLGIRVRMKLAQGCVIEKTDGTKFQLRNFDKSQPWMKPDSFRNIYRIHRSPLRAIAVADC
ncbi:MAG: RRXRR domain-containing protein [Planctomycetia bacterium]|nr:RRXRR domain-containing protein [Planctomycetia bacterium]